MPTAELASAAIALLVKATVLSATWQDCIMGTAVGAQR